MQEEYQAIRRTVEDSRTLGREKITEAFATARQNQEGAARVISRITLFSVLSIVAQRLSRILSIDRRRHIIGSTAMAVRRADRSHTIDTE